MIDVGPGVESIDGCVDCRLSCSLLNLDVMDLSGNHQLGVDHNVFKKTLDADGNHVDEEAQKNTVGGAVAAVGGGGDGGCSGGVVADDAVAAAVGGAAVGGAAVLGAVVLGGWWWWM